MCLKGLDKFLTNSDQTRLNESYIDSYTNSLSLGPHAVTIHLELSEVCLLKESDVAPPLGAGGGEITNNPD